MEITPLVRKLVALAIEEDLLLGDITSQLSVPAERQARAAVVARESMVVCGTALVGCVVKEAGVAVGVEVCRSDGELVGAGEVLVTLRGPARDLLSIERTVLNFMQRLCGVATAARTMVADAAGVTLLDTRKTMPGWRYLDKYAVRTGGARNHRFSLGDMILVKNNHIDAHPGGIRGALSAITSGKPLYMPWEVEVRSLDELSVALEFKPTIVMLDNFSDDQIRTALELLSSVCKAGRDRPLVEVSGGVTRERLSTLRALDIDAVSMGALTTRAPNVDISMRIEVGTDER